MKEQTQAIETFIAKGDIKKADVLVARLLRAEISERERSDLLGFRARIRLLSARPDDAIADLTTIRETSPEMTNSGSLLELLADCYAARYELSSVGFSDRNDAEQALVIYEQIIEQFREYENLGWVYSQLGRVLLATNQIEQAVECFRQALFCPSHIRALTAYCYERLGFIAFYEQRNSQQSLTFLNKAVHTYPSSEDQAWLVQVHILRSRVLRDSEPDAALHAAETALSIASSSSSENKLTLSEALFTVAEFLLKRDGREKDVVNHLQRFLQVSKRPLGVDVTWSRVHEMLGDAHFKLGQYPSAIDAYRTALDLNPYHPWEISVYYRIARSHYQQGSFDEAVAAIDQLLSAAQAEDQEVQDYRVFDVLGNALFALERYDTALQAYETALEKAPPNTDLSKIEKYCEFARELNQPL